MGKAKMVYVLAKNAGADIGAQDAERQSVAWYSAKSGDLATIRMVKSLGGLFTVPRQILERNFGSRDFPKEFNPQFVVRFKGEPSDDDDDDSEEASDANGVDIDGGDQEGCEGEDGL
ncbi:hypothetical protein BKA59DRAFT_550011 [Fusarium tricinctum]|uniref:Uncharacterized protein n=1 Tax=Fusarium tricinctum TaxID=61284 RepID=A0A8K0RN24_9HYPO|nr:hypothetical protein BKA59DRAFT_550011 [Fusarium tricinctum]